MGATPPGLRAATIPRAPRSSSGSPPSSRAARGRQIHCRPLPVGAFVFIVRIVGFFLLASVIGFGIDTALRSVRRRRFAPVRKIPFSPLYGLAGLAILYLPPGLSDGSLALVWLYFALAFCTLEYVAGALILRISGRRIWDYTDRHLHLHGHTDLFHFFLWGTIGTVCRVWAVGPVAGLFGLWG